MDIPEHPANPSGKGGDPIFDSIETIVSMHQTSERRVGTHQRVVETGTALIGRPAVLYAIIAFDAFWIFLNSAEFYSGRRPLDAPPFYWLQGFTSLSAMFISMIVLITQNRQGRISERRSQLDLQINLLNEQKATKIIALLEELRRDMPDVKNRHDPEAEVMTQATDPRLIVEALELRMTEDLREIEEELKSGETG